MDKMSVRPRLPELNINSMNKQLEQVLEWHIKYDIPVAKKCTIPENGRINLRRILIDEECLEVRKVLLDIRSAGVPRSELLAGLAKEICDLIYVAYGTLIEFGLHTSFEECFDEVHASNMTKSIGHKNVFGKVLKGPHFKPADIERLIL